MSSDLPEQEYQLQRQIDQLDSKVERVSDQLTGVREILTDKLEQIRKEADIDRRSFQQAISTMNTQLERNTTSMSGSETRIALIEGENHNIRKSLEALSNRLWWVAGSLFVAVVGIGTDIIKNVVK